VASPFGVETDAFRGSGFEMVKYFGVGICIFRYVYI
jgi:hypothetical protein